MNRISTTSGKRVISEYHDLYDCNTRLRAISRLDELLLDCSINTALKNNTVLDGSGPPHPRLLPSKSGTSLQAWRVPRSCKLTGRSKVPLKGHPITTRQYHFRFRSFPLQCPWSRFQVLPDCLGASAACPARLSSWNSKTSEPQSDHNCQATAKPGLLSRPLCSTCIFSMISRSTPVLSCAQIEQRRKQQRHLNLDSPDIFLASFEFAKDRAQKLTPTTWCMRNCRLSQCVGHHDLDTYYRQEHPSLCAALVHDPHHSKLFINGFHVKFLRKMAWSIASWYALCDVVALGRKPCGETYHQVMDALH